MATQDDLAKMFESAAPAEKPARSLEDEFAAAKPIPKPEAPGAGKTFALHGADSLLFGFGDYLQGAGGALHSLYRRATGEDEVFTPGEAFDMQKNSLRSEMAAGAEAHPVAAGAGTLTGGVAGSFLPGVGVARGAGLASTVGRAALTGGVTGVGMSNADTLPDAATEFGKGAAVGGALGALGHGITKGINKLGDTATRKFLAAQSKIDEFKALSEAEHVAEKASAMRDRYREATSLWRDGELRASQDPEFAVKWAEHKASDAGKKLMSEIDDRILSEAPGKFDSITNARAAFDLAKTEAPGDGPGGIAGSLAGSIGGPLGTVAGGAAGVAASRAVRSVVGLAKDPSVQKVGWSAVRSVVERAPERMGRYAPVLQRAYQHRGAEGLAATHYVLAQQDPEYRQHMASLEQEDGETNE